MRALTNVKLTPAGTFEQRNASSFGWFYATDWRSGVDE